jgi:hypothetical protein
MDGVMTAGTPVVEEEDAPPGVTMTEMSPRTPLMAVPVAAPEEGVMAVASLTTKADPGLPAGLPMALALDEADAMVVPSGVAVADEAAAVVVEEAGVEAAADAMAAIASPPPRTRSMPSSIPTCWAIPRRPR